ncbi:MAG: hypothetical protein ACYTG7_22345 [Planctomycetota bacterium]|jgi:hypothetical protein
MVLPTSCFLLATLFNTAKAIDEAFFATAQAMDLANDRTGTMTLSLTIETSSIIEITKDGTNWEEINGGVAVDANREFIHKFASLETDTINFRAKTATTVRRAILQVDSQEGPAIPPGAAVPLTPWTENVDADGFSLFDLDTIQFRDNVTPPANNIPYIMWETLGTGMVFNVPTGDRIAFSRNGVEQIRMDTLGNLEMLGNSIEMGSGLISFQDSNHFIIQSGADIAVFLPTGSAFDVIINSLNEYQFEETNAIWNGNNITELSNIVFQNTVLAPLATEPAIWADTGGVNINVPNVDAVTFSVNGVDEYRFSSTLFDMNGNRIVDVSWIESNDAAHASLGVLRMGVLETIGWRNNAGTNNNLLSFAGDVFSIGFDLVNEYFFSATELDLNGNNLWDIGYLRDASGVEALSGFIRMANNTVALAWRNAGNTADLAIKIDASDHLVFNSTSELFGANIITNHPTATPVATDFVIFHDATDGLIKKGDVAAFLSAASQTPWTSNIDGAGFNLTDVGNLQADSFELINAGTGANPVFSSNSTIQMVSLDGPAAATPGATHLQINQNGNNNTISIPYSILEFRARDSNNVATVPIFRIDTSFQGSATSANYTGFVEFVGIAAADEVVFLDYSATLNKINIRGYLDMNGDHIQEVDYIEFESNTTDPIPDADPDSAIRLPNDRHIAFGDSITDNREWKFGLTTLEYFEMRSPSDDGLIRLDLWNDEQELVGTAYETGGFRIRGKDSGGGTTTWAEIVVNVNDNTAASEDSSIQFEVYENGTAATKYLTLNDSTSLTNILFSKDLDVSAVNIITDTTTGTKIGTATNQKIGFFNATPVVQQTHIADPSGGSTVDSEARTAINGILAQLAALGLQAST